MPTPVIRYPLDRTGKLPSHLVLREPHVVPSGRAKIFAPNYGPFYADSLKVYVRGSQEPLPKSKYKPAQMLSDVTLRFTKQICALVSIDESVTDTEFEIDYQVLGGDYVQSVEAIEDMIRALGNQKKPVYWGSIIGKPEKYPAGPHLHDIGDLYGFEYVVAALEAVRRAILYGSESQFEDLMEILNQFRNDYDAKLNALKDLLDEHIRNIQNPHGTTKVHVGLGNVEDYGIATVTEACTASVKNKYLTPFLLHEVLKDYSKTTTVGEMSEWGYWRDNSTGYTRMWGRTPELRYGDLGRCYFRRRMTQVFSIVGDTQHRYIQPNLFPKPELTNVLARLRVAQLKHLMSNRGFGIAVVSTDEHQTGENVNRERVVYTWSAEGVSEANAPVGTRPWERLTPTGNFNYTDNGDGDGYRSGGPNNWINYNPMDTSNAGEDITPVPFRNGSFEQGAQYWTRAVIGGSTADIPVFVEPTEPRVGADLTNVFRLKTNLDQYYINDARIAVTDNTTPVKVGVNYRVMDTESRTTDQRSNVAGVLVFFDAKGREISRSEKWGLGNNNINYVNLNAIGRWYRVTHQATPTDTRIKFYTVGVKIRGSNASSVEIDNVRTDWDGVYFDSQAYNNPVESPFYNGDLFRGDVGWESRDREAADVDQFAEVQNQTAIRVRNNTKLIQHVYNQGVYKIFGSHRRQILAAAEAAIFSSKQTRAYVAIRFYNSQYESIANVTKSTELVGSTSGAFNGTTVTVEPNQIPQNAYFYRVLVGAVFTEIDAANPQERVYFKRVTHGTHSNITLPPFSVSGSIAPNELNLTEQNSYTGKVNITVTSSVPSGQYTFVIQPINGYNTSQWSVTKDNSVAAGTRFTVTYTGTQDQTTRNVQIAYQITATRTQDNAKAYVTVAHNTQYTPPSLADFNPVITNLNHLVGVEANQTTASTAFTWTHAGTPANQVEVTAHRIVTNPSTGSFEVTTSGQQFNVALVKSYREKITQADAQTVTAEYRFRRTIDNKVVTRQVTFRPWIKPPYTYDGTLALAVTPASQSAIIMSPSETFKTTSFNISATPANQGIQIEKRLVSISNSAQFNATWEGNQLKVTYTGPNDLTQRSTVAVVEYKATRGDGATAVKTVQFNVERKREALPAVNVSAVPSVLNVSFAAPGSTTIRAVSGRLDITPIGHFYTYDPIRVDPVGNNNWQNRYEFTPSWHNPDTHGGLIQRGFYITVRDRESGNGVAGTYNGKVVFRVVRHIDGASAIIEIPITINTPAPSYGDLSSTVSVLPTLLNVNVPTDGGTAAGSLNFRYTGQGTVTFEPRIQSGNGGHLSATVSATGTVVVGAQGPSYHAAVTTDFIVHVRARRQEDGAVVDKYVTVRATQPKKTLGSINVATNPSSGVLNIPADGGTVNGQTQLSITPTGYPYTVTNMQFTGNQDVFTLNAVDQSTGKFRVSAQANRGTADRSRSYTVTFNVRRDTDGATASGTYSLTVNQPKVVVAPPPLTMSVTPASKAIDMPKPGGTVNATFTVTTSPDPLSSQLYETSATIVSGDQSLWTLSTYFEHSVQGGWSIGMHAIGHGPTPVIKKTTYTLRLTVRRRSDNSTASRDVSVTITQPATVTIANPTLTLSPASTALSIPKAGGTVYQQFTTSVQPTGHNYSYQGRLVSGDLNQFSAAFGNDLRFRATANGTTPYDKNVTFTVEVTATRTSDNKSATRTATVTVTQPRTLPPFSVAVNPTHKNVNLPATGGNHSFNYTFSPSPSAGGYSITRVDVAGSQDVFTVNIGNDGSLWVDRPHPNHGGATHAREYTLIWHARRNEDGAMFQINSHLTVHQPVASSGGTPPGGGGGGGGQPPGGGGGGTPPGNGGPPPQLNFSVNAPHDVQLRNGHGSFIVTANVPTNAQYQTDAQVLFLDQIAGDFNITPLPDGRSVRIEAFDHYHTGNVRIQVELTVTRLSDGAVGTKRSNAIYLVNNRHGGAGGGGGEGGGVGDGGHVTQPF